MRILLRTLTLSLGVLTAAPLVAADAPRATRYVRIYSDSAGVSHFKDEQLAFAPNADGRTGGPMIHPLAGAQGAVFLRLKSGAQEDWHKAPRRLYLIAVQGLSEVTASDGEVRRFAPGSILLMDDTDGKGHQTRAIGPEDHVAVLISIVSDGPVSPAGPPSK